jgi:Dimerisation domain of Zinc Transporter
VREERPAAKHSPNLALTLATARRPQVSASRRWLGRQFARIEHELAHVPGVDGIDQVQVRWIGHEVHVDADVAIAADLPLAATHDIPEDARHRLLHTISRLGDAHPHPNPA